jgi:hypothetical protein
MGCAKSIHRGAGRCDWKKRVAGRRAPPALTVRPIGLERTSFTRRDGQPPPAEARLSPIVAASLGTQPNLLDDSNGRCTTRCIYMRGFGTMKVTATQSQKANMAIPPLCCRGRRNGLPCPDQELISAHIVPRGSARRVRRQFDNMEVTEHGARKAAAQLGIFDENILCKTCDGVLGELDDYALKTLDRIRSDLISEGNLWALPNVDGDKFATFILAVLWRASISNLRDVAKVDLGPYEDVARSVIFGEAPLSSFDQFKVILARYRSRLKVNTEHMYSIPVPIRTSHLKGYGFALGGFEIYAKVDRQPFASHWTEIIVNGNIALRGFYKDFENSGPFETARRAVLSKLAPKRTRRMA